MTHTNRRAVLGMETKDMIYPKYFAMSPEDNGGASGGGTTPPTPPTTPTPPVDAGANGGGSAPIDPEDHKRALADMHKFKTRAQQLEQEAEQMRTKALKEKEDWKSIAELNEKKANELTESNRKLSETFTNHHKYSAVKEKCLALGLRPEAVADLDGLDLSDVRIETTSTGKINVLGVSQFAELLKGKRPHWFTDPKAPRVNTDGTRVVDGGGGNETITPAMLLAAEKEAKKTGNPKPYYDMHASYLKQKRAGGAR